MRIDKYRQKQVGHPWLDMAVEYRLFTPDMPENVRRDQIRRKLESIRIFRPEIDPPLDEPVVLHDIGDGWWKATHIVVFYYASGRWLCSTTHADGVNTIRQVLQSIVEVESKKPTGKEGIGSVLMVRYHTHGRHELTGMAMEVWTSWGRGLPYLLGR